MARTDIIDIFTRINAMLNVYTAVWATIDGEYTDAQLGLEDGV